MDRNILDVVAEGLIPCIRQQVLKVASLGDSCVRSATVFGCNLFAAFFSSKRDFPDLFRNFTTSQRVIVVFRELPWLVAALD
jgi:hypothetical protein